MPLRTLLPMRTEKQGQITIGGRLVGDRVLVPLLTGDAAGVVDQVKVGIAIAHATGGSVRIDDPMTHDVPAHRTITPDDDPASVSSVVEWSLGVTSKPGRGDGLFAARRTERRVLEHIRDDDADTIVIPRASAQGVLGHRRLRRIATRSPANVIWVNGDPGFHEFASILLPIADGPHSGLATDVAGAIAHHVDAYVDVLHVAPPNGDDTAESAEERVEKAIARLDLGDRATPWVLESTDPAATIVEQSDYYGLTVIGAPAAGRLQQFVYGSTSRSIRSQAENMVIAARTADASN